MTDANKPAVEQRQVTRATPLVSVTVISYNAAATIGQTLDSILQQDGGTSQVELVVSDDASRDETVAIAERWLQQNGSAFANARLIVNPVNGGVSANCNVAWRAARGVWVKTIAADDILLPNCLQSNLAYVRSHPDCAVLFSRMRWFGSVDRVTPEPSQLPFFELPALEQYKLLRFESFNFAPTSFIRREALAAVGYADERFRNIEDWPLWMKFTRSGYGLRFNDSVTVCYRVSESISKSSSRFANLPFLRDVIQIHREQAPLESDGLAYRYRRFERSMGLYSTLIISRLTRNRRNTVSRSLEFIALLMRPVDLWGAIRRRFGRMTSKSSV